MPVSPIVSAAIEELRSKLQRVLPQARWVARENLHLTLAFLGDVENSKLDAVCGAVRDVASRQFSFEAACRGVGAFPNLRRPSVVWVGFGGDGASRLKMLHEELAHQLEGLGFEREPQFTPHLTVARWRVPRRGGTDVAPELGRFRDWTGGTLAVSEVVVYSSHLSNDGARHQPIARAPLMTQGCEASTSETT